MLRLVPVRALPLAIVAVLSLGACAPTRVAVAPLPPVPEEEIGEGPEIEEEKPAAPVRDLLGATAYDLPVEANSWVEAELDFLVGQRSAVIGRWIARGDYYERYIKETLAGQGLPTDLYHLAMIESGFQPTVRSRAGAVGMWQFMPSTGRLEGLRVDSVVDERMDPVRSTRAAARHLKRLRGLHRDWALAAAAYNAGSGRISRGLQAVQASDFWDLAARGTLADETKHYVPRLYAVTIIARDRARFGFALPDSAAPRFAFDSIRVDLATPLRELATLGDVSLEELRRLNPHLLEESTPSGSYWLWVPVGRAVALQEAFLASEYRKNGGYGSYTVRNGDSLEKIAGVAQLPAARVREMNPGVGFEKLRIGARLKLPRPAADALAARAREQEKEERLAAASEKAARKPGKSADAPSAEERGGAEKKPAAAGARNGAEKKASGAASGTGREHVVTAGETLWGIAREHGLSVEEIQAASGLSGTTIVVGQTLRLPAAKGKAMEHVVQSGDTLWGIARAYGSTVTAIEEANALERGAIVPGQRLTIPR